MNTIGNVPRTVWRICILMLGFKVLTDLRNMKNPGALRSITDFSGALRDWLLIWSPGSFSVITFRTLLNCLGYRSAFSNLWHNYVCARAEYALPRNTARRYYAWGDISGNKSCKETKNASNVNTVYLCSSGVRREHYETDIMVIRFLKIYFFSTRYMYTVSNKKLWFKINKQSARGCKVSSPKLIHCAI